MQDLAWAYHQANENRLPHALLLLAKDALALTEFAQFLLCIKPSQHACGACHACCLFQSGHHNDFCLIKPERVDGPIKIEQIRQLSQFTAGLPMISPTQVVLIEQAATMNRQAQNALLKTLEEPAPKTVLLLQTDSLVGLLPTILSRVVRLNLSSNVINEPALLDEVFRGLQACLRQPSDCLKAAETWAKQDVKQVLYSIQIVITALLKEQQGINSKLKTLERAAVQGFAQRMPTQKLWQFYQAVNQSLQAWIQSSLNGQLLLDDLLIQWGTDGR